MINSAIRHKFRLTLRWDFLLYTNFFLFLKMKSCPLWSRCVPQKSLKQNQPLQNASWKKLLTLGKVNSLYSIFLGKYNLIKVYKLSYDHSWQHTITFTGEQLVNSKYAENLEQLHNGVKVPPRGWKCEK